MLVPSVVLPFVSVPSLEKNRGRWGGRMEIKLYLYVHNLFLEKNENRRLLFGKRQSCRFVL